jgi:hypothetical protein
MGLAKHKHDSDNNNGNYDDSNKKQQLRIHVRRILFGGFPLLPFDPALGERPRVPRRGRPAVASLAARTWGRTRGGRLSGELLSMAAAGAARGHSS